MNKLNGLYFSFLLAGMLGFSACTDENRETGQNGKTISLDIPVEILGMESAGNGEMTRATDGGLELAFGDDGVNTRASMTTDEKKVTSLCVVQFDGTATGSKAVAFKTVVRDASNKVIFANFDAVDAAGRIYIVANITPAVTKGTTTLGDFEKSLAAYSSYTAVATAGLPMCGYADFNPKNVATIPTVQLKALVAKLTVTYTVTGANLFKAGTTPTLMLKNLPSGAAYGVTTNVNAAYKPTGVTYSDKSVGNIGTTYTFYVPENIAGANSAASTWSKRSVKNIPANTNPLYFEITGRTYDDKNTATIASFIGDPAKPTEYNILRNTAYTLTATIKNLSTTDERITVTPDYFNLNTDGTSKGYANCYIITDNESKDYGFDATKRGNGVESGTDLSGIKYSTLPVMSTATSAKVIWQTGGTTAVVKSVRLEDGKVIFTTGTATEGNAVIGIFDSSNLCVWSWHIWKLNGTAPGTVTGSKTSATTGGTVNVTMMDRNLGAYNNTPANVGSIGLLYQWGRKDPFPGPGVFGNTEPTNIYGSWNNGSGTGSWSGTYSIKTVATDGTVGTEAWAVKYPTAFILKTSSPYDWMYTKNDYLWGTPWEAGGTGSYNKNQGTKSIYDPCPIGYRVPPQDTWSKQTGNGSFSNNGIILGSFHASLWFPAAGYRDGSSVGGLGSITGCGDYWSSSPFAASNLCGGHLYFLSDGMVWPQYSSSRARGFSVRCVSEL